MLDLIVSKLEDNRIFRINTNKIDLNFNSKKISFLDGVLFFQNIDNKMLFLDDNKVIQIPNNIIIDDYIFKYKNNFIIRSSDVSNNYLTIDNNGNIIDYLNTKIYGDNLQLLDINDNFDLLFSNDQHLYWVNNQNIKLKDIYINDNRLYVNKNKILLYNPKNITIIDKNSLEIIKNIPVNIFYDNYNNIKVKIFDNIIYSIENNECHIYLDNSFHKDYIIKNINDLIIINKYIPIKINKDLIIYNNEIKPRIQLQIVADRGIGDLLVNSSLAAGFSENGYDVSITLADIKKYDHKVSVFDIKMIPFLPLISTSMINADKIYINAANEDHHLRWWDEKNIYIDSFDQARIQYKTTPLVGCVKFIDSDKKITSNFVNKQYILLAPDGNSAYEEKRISDTQIEQIYKVANLFNYQIVIVSTFIEHRELPGGIIDLRGKTTIEELFALTENASAVVCADTGIGHIAAAYYIPTLWLCPKRTSPYQSCQHYKPSLWIEECQAKDISNNTLSKYLIKLLYTIDVKWCIVTAKDGIKEPCGINISARRIAEISGVELCNIKDGPPMKPYIIDYHGLDYDHWIKFLTNSQTTKILSIHSDEQIPENLNGFVRGKNLLKNIKDSKNNFYYVPLPTFPERDVKQFKIGLVATHGRPNISYHGYDIFEKAMEIVKKEIPYSQLKIVTSSNNSILTEDEIIEQLSDAQVFVYPYTVDREQSSCPSDVMIFGRPIIISESTAFDDYRGWCITCGSYPELLAEEIIKLISNKQYYEKASELVKLGGCYRSVKIIAKQYRAAIIQEILKQEEKDISFENIFKEVNDYTLLEEERLKEIYNNSILSKSLEGCAVELGCLKGGVSKLLAKISKKPVHIFDTFAGLPEEQIDYDGLHVKGEFKENIKNVKKYLKDDPYIFIHQGIFPETAIDVGPIAIAHCDCDSEIGTREFLKWAWPKLSPNGIIIIDDYNWIAGVTRAVNEFCSQHSIEVIVTAPLQCKIIKIGDRKPDILPMLKHRGFS